jgi:hypothetical protein
MGGNRPCKAGLGFGQQGGLGSTAVGSVVEQGFQELGCISCGGSGSDDEIAQEGGGCWICLASLTSRSRATANIPAGAADGCKGGGGEPEKA